MKIGYIILALMALMFIVMGSELRTTINSTTFETTMNNVSFPEMSNMTLFNESEHALAGVHANNVFNIGFKAFGEIIFEGVKFFTRLGYHYGSVYSMDDFTNFMILVIWLVVFGVVFWPLVYSIYFVYYLIEKLFCYINKIRKVKE